MNQSQKYHSLKPNQSQNSKDGLGWQNFVPKGRVVVIFGGMTEREISLESGKQIMQSLKKSEQKYDIEVIGFDYSLTNPITNILKIKPDLVFIALHGGAGEDGTIQGFLQSVNIAYTGSGVLASALSMDKVVSKQLWLKFNLPCPDYVLISNQKVHQFINPSLNELFKKTIQKLDLPFVMKPIASGSSLGVSLVKNFDEFIPALKFAQKHSKANQMIMAEQYIKGSEVTVSFLHNQPIGLTAVEVSESFYDYQAKYLSNQTRLICPAPLPADLSQKIIELATEGYHSLKMSGWGRVDLMLNQKNEPFLIEVNTVPGMTTHSLVPSAASSIGIDFDELVIKILQTAHTIR